MSKAKVTPCNYETEYDIQKNDIPMIPLTSSEYSQTQMDLQSDVANICRCEQLINHFSVQQHCLS